MGAKLKLDLQFRCFKCTVNDNGNKVCSYIEYLLQKYIVSIVAYCQQSIYLIMHYTEYTNPRIVSETLNFLLINRVTKQHIFQENLSLGKQI